MEHPLNNRSSAALTRAESSGRLPVIQRASFKQVESAGRLHRRPSLNQEESSGLMLQRPSLNHGERSPGLLLRRRPAQYRTMSSGHLLQQPSLNSTKSSGLLLRRRQTVPENIVTGYSPRPGLEHVFDATSVPASPMRTTSFAELGVLRLPAPAETGPPSPTRRRLYRQDWETDNPLAFSSGILQHSSRLFSKAELDIWGPQATRREDPKWQKRKMEIIKNLLEKFSLEKTIRKYECLEPMEYRLDQRCFSIHCAAESEVIRKRMLYLMGTDVCRINDKHFIERLQVRVQDEYEKEQENKERQLAEKERLRQRRLISEGVMTAEQLREQDSTKWRKQRRTRTPPPGEEQDRKLVQEKARPITYHDKDKGKHKGSKEEENQQKKEDEDGDNKSQKEKGDDEKREGEGDENGADEEIPEDVNGENRDGKEEEGAQGEEQERDDSEGWHCDSDRPNYQARNDDPLIKKLRHQETTGGIYHTANEVLLGEPCGGDCEF